MAPATTTATTTALPAFVGSVVGVVGLVGIVGISLRRVCVCRLAGDFLAEEFLGVYPTGFIGRDDHVAELDAGPIVVDYEILETRCLPVAHDSALLAYRVRFRPTAMAEPVTWMVASIWRREGDGTLVNTFSQDTPVPQ